MAYGQDPGDAGLVEADLAGTPLAQFERWYAEAGAAGLPEPNAMVLATVDPSGSPSVRTVLLKDADRRGFVFYTNYGSRKALQIAADPHVALVFAWHPMARQVAVRGRAEKVPVEESAAYFAVRPLGVADRRLGQQAVRAAELPRGSRAALGPSSRSAGRTPAAPTTCRCRRTGAASSCDRSRWSSGRGRPSRLHDRLVYVPREPGSGFPGLDDDAAWRVLRRQP